MENRPGPGEVTELLRSLKGGRSEVEPRIYELLYGELKRIATARMRMERPNHTLTPTALVSEAWVRMRGLEPEFEDRQHFLALAATAMRRILVDYGRARRAQCRGNGIAATPLDEMCEFKLPLSPEDLLTLDEALRRLDEMSPRAARVVEMRFFAGLTEAETAAALDVTRRTVNRDWEMARTWLFGQLRDARPEGRAAVTMVPNDNS